MCHWQLACQCSANGALSRCFGKTVALDGVDLEIAEGSVYGLVGENGAGKTTLVKHLRDHLVRGRLTASSPGTASARETRGRISRTP